MTLKEINQDLCGVYEALGVLGVTTACVAVAGVAANFLAECTTGQHIPLNPFYNNNEVQKSAYVEVSAQQPASSRASNGQEVRVVGQTVYVSAPTKA